jgi:OOP family OmpA-OmpF porin
MKFPVSFSLHTFFTFCSLLLFHAAGSQNLVVNTTFEAKTIRSGYGEIIKAQSWGNANRGSADLFDKRKAAVKTSPNGIPYNYMGYQPSGDGQNYAGIVAYYDDSDRWLPFSKGYKRYSEYLEGEFREPMVAGMVYEVSFRVSLADKSGRAVSCLGALLTTEKVKQDNNTFLSLQPQFISHRVISDSVNWVILSGAYVASGGEKYITIGCFKDDYFTVETVAATNRNDSRKAYYYVSEVSVKPYVSSRSNLDAMVLGVDYVEIMNLQFASGSAYITQQFYPELDDIAAWMVRYPDYRFFIAGYTDGQGTTAANNQLSAERARSVKDYLVSKGVKADNIFTEGFGSENPVENKWKSEKNRRVEIYLYTVNKLSRL